MISEKSDISNPLEKDNFQMECLHLEEIRVDPTSILFSNKKFYVKYQTVFSEVKKNHWRRESFKKTLGGGRLSKV